MNQNKILNHFFKKLILENYSNEEIINFLSFRYKFNHFNHFIYYLWLLSNDKQKINDENYKYATILKKYLLTIIETNQINNLEYNNLTSNLILTNTELYLINIKNYDINQYIYLFDDRLVIFINDDCIKDNDVYLLILNKHFITQILKINQQSNNNDYKILIFKKINNYTNKFIGYYQHSNIKFLYINNQWNYYLMITNDCDKFKQYDNNYINYLAQFKRDIIYFLEQHNVYDSNIINIINQQNNIFLIINNLLQDRNINSEFSLFKNLLLYLNKENLIKNFSIFNLLINDNAIINHKQLLLLSNHLNFMIDDFIYSDYLNNIYVIYEQKNNYIQIKNNAEFYLKLIQTNNCNWFDNNLNKKIFDTANNANSLYLFLKLNDNQYMFKGIFKVKKMFFNQNNEPIFLLYKVNLKHLIKHYLYVHQNIINNQYKNIFIKNLNKEILTKFNIRDDLENIKQFNIKNDKLNSLLFKYNWIIFKFISEINNNEILEYYFNLYKELIMRLDAYFDQFNSYQYEDLLIKELIDIDKLVNFYINKINNNVLKQKLINLDSQQINKKHKIISLLAIIDKLNN